MLSQGFLLPALEKGEGWNSATSGYSNEGLLLNSSVKNKPISMNLGYKAHSVSLPEANTD